MKTSKLWEIKKNYIIYIQRRISFEFMPVLDIMWDKSNRVC